MISMGHSRDFKEREVEYFAAGHTAKEVCAIFKVARSTLYEWSEQAVSGFPETVRRTYVRKIDKEVLKKALEEKPDSELAELAALFGCTPQAISNALKRMGYTRKKRRLHTPKSRKKHAPSIRRS